MWKPQSRGERTEIYLSRNETKNLPFYRGPFEAVGSGRWSLDVASSCGNRGLGNFAHDQVVDLRPDRRIGNALLARGSSSCWVAPSALNRFYFLWRLWGRELGTGFNAHPRGSFERFIAVRPNVLCSYDLNAALRSRPLRL